MNVSYNWLHDYLQFDLTPDETAKALTSIGLEVGGVEEVQSIKGGLEGLVVGHVLSCVPHPNSDHLHVTSTDIGAGTPLQIVCGAPNVAQGQKVVVATLGTKLYAGDECFTIKKSKIRGEESFGMLCAEDEIGIGKSHEGIIELPQDAPVGMLVKDYYGIKSDYIIEVDITPNRIDAASHYGVARDLAAFLKQNHKSYTLTRPSVETFSIAPSENFVRASIENKEACIRYSGVTIEGVKVKESPDWLKQKLTSIGLRPINNIVDITNFMLHETGLPLHAFDKSKIKGNQIKVQTLPEGTKFVTLDGVERTLSSQDLMICNAEEGMCLAGVFGGLDSGVTEKTTDVFIESACFHPTWIRKTARRHGLNTDASFRFERGADPNNTLYVLKRAALLVQELAEGKVVGEIQDIYPSPIEPFPVELTFRKLNQLSGIVLSKETIRSILQSLEIEITKETEEEMFLKVPTYRTDVRRDVDVIEDILRIYGYDNVGFGEKLNSCLSYQTATDRDYKLKRLVSEQLVGSGFNEIMNNSLTKVSYYENSQCYPLEHCVKLMNPLSADLGVMRQTLLYGGLESIAYNRNRQNGNLSFFEFGNVYSFDASKKNEEKTLSGYFESSHLGVWMCGNHIEKSWTHAEEKTNFAMLKAHIEHIFDRLGIARRMLEVKQMEDEIFSAFLSYTSVKGEEVAKVGILSPKIVRKFDIDVEVFFAEINWSRLMKMLSKENVKYKDLPKFPAVRRDLALLIDQKTTFEEIEKIVTSTEKKLVSDVKLFDVYEGKNLPDGKKSYAIAITLLDKEKTLTDKQIETTMLRIQKQLEGQLGATLR